MLLGCVENAPHNAGCAVCGFVAWHTIDNVCFLTCLWLIMSDSLLAALLSSQFMILIVSILADNS